MRFTILFALSFAAVSVTGCGSPSVQPAAQETQTAEATSQISIEGGANDSQSFVTFQASEEIDGSKPQLTISCEDGSAKLLSIDVVREPKTPPPLAGVMGSFMFDDAEPISVEAGWMPPSSWAVRNDDDASAMIARSILSSEWVAFSVAGPHGSDEIEWTIKPTSQVADYLSESCGAPKRATRR